MPSTPRGRNAATTVAVVLAILLALVWLRSSGADTPSVPIGLPVETVPAAVEAPARPAGLGQERSGAEAASAGARLGGQDRERPKRRHRGERVRRRAGRRGADRAPPPPSAGSGGAAGGTGGATSAAPQQVPPEFALG